MWLQILYLVPQCIYAEVKFIFAIQQGQRDRMFPILVFSAVCLAGAIVTFFLPETRGQKLPETVQDVEDMGLAS